MAGLIIKIKNTVTRKSGEKMAILKIEDLEGTIEVLVFPESYKQNSRYIQPNSAVLVSGRLSLKEESPKIIAHSILPVDEAYKQTTKIDINIAGIRENLLQSLKEKLVQNSARPRYTCTWIFPIEPDTRSWWVMSSMSSPIKALSRTQKPSWERRFFPCSNFSAKLLI